MTTIAAIVAGLILATGTTVGVVHSLHDSTPRSTPGSGQSSVVLYGSR